MTGVIFWRNIKNKADNNVLTKEGLVKRRMDQEMGDVWGPAMTHRVTPVPLGCVTTLLKEGVDGFSFLHPFQAELKSCTRCVDKMLWDHDSGQ